jgi:hypothetical protein
MNKNIIYMLKLLINMMIYKKWMISTRTFLNKLHKKIKLINQRMIKQNIQSKLKRIIQISNKIIQTNKQTTITKMILFKCLHPYQRSFKILCL